MSDIPKSVTVTTHNEVITVKADSKPVTVHLPSILSATPIVTKVHISKKDPRMALLEYRHYPNGEVQCLLHHGVQHMRIKGISLDDYVTVDDPVVIDFMVSEHNSFIMEHMMPLVHEQQFFDLRNDAILATELSSKRGDDNGPFLKSQT